MEKLSTLYHKYRVFVWLIGLVLLVLIGLGIWHNNSKTDVLEDAKIEFTGYNKQGSASLSDDETASIKKNILIALLKSGKANKATIKYVTNTQVENIDQETLNNLSDNQALINEALKATGNMDIKISPDTKLSNGGHVTVKLGITDAEAKQYKLSNKSHTFKVSGLKKTTNITASDVAKKFKFDYSGYDQYGSLQIYSKTYGSENLAFNVKDNGKLKNGEKITLSLPKEFTSSLLDNGKTFVGSRQFTTTVSGLKTFGSVANASDVIRFNNEAADNLLDLGSEFSVYSAKKLINTYLFAYDPMTWGGFTAQTTDNSATSHKVSVVSSKSDLDPYNTESSDETGLTEAGLYEVTAMDDGAKTYKLIGYSDLALKSGKLNISSKDDDSVDSIDFESSSSLTSIEQQLKANGIPLQ